MREFQAVHKVQPINIKMFSKSAIFKRKWLITQKCSSIQGAQITVESVFIGRFTVNNIAPKLQKCWTPKIAFKIISKMLKQPNFFHSQPSALPKDALAKFYLSTTFGSSFMISCMISFVAPTRSLTVHEYLISKIRNRNLKKQAFSETHLPKSSKRNADLHLTTPKSRKSEPPVPEMPNNEPVQHSPQSQQSLKISNHQFHSYSFIKVLNRARYQDL